MVAAFRVFRALFFGLLAVDTFWAFAFPAEPSSLLVSKLPLLFEDGLDWVPTPKLLARVHGVASLAALAAALGPDAAYTRAACAAAACYIFAYFGDATDRYQHHYLLCLLLALLPWARDHAWVKRLVAVQVAIVYFWTAVAKLADGGLFLEGHFVRMVVQRKDAYEWLHWVSGIVGVDEVSLWSAIAVQVVAAELALCVLLLTGRAPWLTCALGIAMHLGFEFVGRLSIGYFSWYMVALYIWLLPLKETRPSI